MHIRNERMRQRKREEDKERDKGVVTGGGRENDREGEVFPVSIALIILIS